MQILYHKNEERETAETHPREDNCPQDCDTGKAGDISIFTAADASKFA